MNYLIIYTTEKSVLQDMEKYNIKKVTLFITAYVDHSNYVNYGYSVENINTNSHYDGKTLASKTKTFKRV